MNREKVFRFLTLFCSAMIIFNSCGGGGGSKKNGSDKISLEAPSEINATEGVYKEKVEIDWNDVEAAEYYVLYKSIDNREQFRAISTNLAESSYTDTEVTPNRIYYYRVAAGYGDTWGEQSPDVRGFAHTGKPLSPENVTATTGRIGEITVTWDASPQTDYYIITRSDSPDGEYIQIASEITATSYTDNDPNLIRDKEYFYRIIAVNITEGESDPGEAAAGIALQDIPLPPAAVSATDGTYGNKVEVTWNISEHAVTYIVYRAPDISGAAGTYAIIGKNITIPLFEDVTAEHDVIYHYTVTAVSSGGESIKSNSDAGLIATGAPIQTAAPGNIMASDGNPDTVTVTWNAAEGASAYSVYRCDTINGTYTLIPESYKTTATSFQDTPPQLVQRYYYLATSWSSGDDSVESHRSVSDEGYAMPQIAEVPSGIAATTSRKDARIVLTWSNSARADSYKLYRSDSADGSFNLLASGITQLTYTDEHPSISIGKAYFYVITAVNASGESNKSIAVSGNTVMQTPGNVTITKTGRYSRSIRWSPVTGAIAYEVDHGVYNSWKNTITVTAAECSFADLQNSVRHDFRVRAINETTESSSSDIVSAFVVWLE